MKYAVFALIVFVIAGAVGALIWLTGPGAVPEYAAEGGEAQQGGEHAAGEMPAGETADDVPAADEAAATETILGRSAGGRDIVARHFGEGEREVLFVGGIHGGYSWNTALLGFELIDYLTQNPDAVPEGLRVTVVPVLNPDGLYAVVGTSGRFVSRDVPADADTVAGRFNGNGVDVNRNFGCDWEPTGTWQNREVDAGEAAFSEPEAAAIERYVSERGITGAVVWYSAAGGVFASDCHGGVLPGARALMNAYADASGYPARESFDYYELTGDMVNWLAKEGVPAVSVLLSTHDETEWEQNRAGILAALNYFAE